MIPILYESNETAFTSNGLGRMRDCISCKVKEERNGVYECEFEYPTSGQLYEKILSGRIIACTHDDEGDVQPFDIIGHTKPINGIVTFHAVHVSYRLNYAPMIPSAPIPTRSVGAYMTVLRNGLVNPLTGNPWPYIGQGKDFQFETDLTGTGDAKAFMDNDGTYRMIRSLLGGTEGSLLDTFHGEFKFDKFTVKLLRNRGVKRNLTVRYGVNMAEYNDETDGSGAYNCAIAQWKGDDNGANKTVVTRVESGFASYNGRKDYTILDMSDKFESAPTAAQLAAAAKRQITNDVTYLPASSINVKFVRIQDDPEYQNLKGLYKCNLCDTIRVVFPAYGLDADFKIVSTTYDVLMDRYEEMELGTLQTTLAEALSVSSGGGSSGTAQARYADYVSEKGTSGSWKYRKWKSGKIEAWATLSKSVAITTASPAYGGYRTASEITFAIPSGIFSSTPGIVLATKSGANSARVMNMHANSATELAGYFSSAASETLNCSVNFYVVQN